VVSDWPSGGNQLAVFPDAAGIAGQTMQRPARELNFPETTFVLPPSNPLRTCRVPIFTPRQELPSAGHPTLGTAAVPARRNGAQVARQFVSEEGTGPVTVTVDGPETSLHLRPPPATRPPAKRRPRP
jgi:trans-2,3-dihydro-3-hydroxyanthranilate isomerase